MSGGGGGARSSSRVQRALDAWVKEAQEKYSPEDWPDRHIVGKLSYDERLQARVLAVNADGQLEQSGRPSSLNRDWAGAMAAENAALYVGVAGRSLDIVPEFESERWLERARVVLERIEANEPVATARDPYEFAIDDTLAIELRPFYAEAFQPEASPQAHSESRNALHGRFEAAQRRLTERVDELAEWLGETAAVDDIRAASGEMGEVMSLYRDAQPAPQPAKQSEPANPGPAPDLGEVF